MFKSGVWGRNENELGVVSVVDVVVDGGDGAGGGVG
jgi:hypothetical protein